jgi:metal-responsive CopG/Arc/MetJ family transcriptional regulator
VSIEQGLLQRADALAKRRGISRSQLISRGLELALAEK